MRSHATTIASLALAPICAAQAPYFQDLGHPAAGFTTSTARGLSADGLVVVGEQTPAAGATEAFRWTEATGLTVIPPGPGFGARVFAWDVSNDGDVVAGYGDFGACREAFRWTEAAGMEAIGLLPGSSCSEARGISADGNVIVGIAGFKGFVWSETTGMLDLGILPSHPHFPGCPPFAAAAYDASSDGSIIVGSSTVLCGSTRWSQAVRHVSGLGLEGLGFLAGGTHSEAVAVSDDGLVIVGQGNSDQSGGEMFRWTSSEGVQPLGLPAGATTCIAADVSGDGSVVLGWADGDPAGLFGFGPVIWDAASGTRRLTDVLVGELGLDLGGWTLDQATAISADGRTIVGSGRNPAGDTHAWIAFLGSDTACYADCDESGSLDFFDFLCFQNAFASGDPYADCDESGSLDFFDFLCFQNAFAAGCP